MEYCYYIRAFQLEQSSKASTRHFKLQLFFPQTRRYKPNVVLSLPLWEMLIQAIFFCASSDLIANPSLLTSTESNQLTFLRISLLRRAFHSETFFPRTATLGIRQRVDASPNNTKILTSGSLSVNCHLSVISS